MRTGLVSVTFRQLSAREIISLCHKAGFCGIEWGGDVHVPNAGTAHTVRAMMEESGLLSLSYGSYYMAGEGGDFGLVLDTARALGTHNIRIWAGRRGSAEADDGYRRCVVEAIRAAADSAAEHSITVSLEYHGGTLTDTIDSTLRLLEEINHENLFTYWQPAADLPHELSLEHLKLLFPTGRLKNIHTFYWRDGERLPLSAGAGFWRECLTAVPGFNGDMLLEFVRGDEPLQFLEDALTLNEIIMGGNNI